MIPTQTAKANRNGHHSALPARCAWSLKSSLCVIFDGPRSPQPTGERSHAGPLTPGNQKQDLPALAGAIRWAVLSSLRNLDP